MMTHWDGWLTCGPDDDKDVEVRVNGMLVLRLEPGSHLTVRCWCAECRARWEKQFEDSQYASLMKKRMARKDG